MEREVKEYTPRIWRIESRPTASGQRIPFVDNRPVNLRSPIQLCKKKFDPRNPYDNSMSGDNILMGREVECGFILLSFKEGCELGNGVTLAKSENCRSVEVARIELQVEGEKRGTFIIEVIYGPMTGEEYTGFRKVRHLLYEVLETASANKLSLDTAIRIFNDQLVKMGKEGYKLTLKVPAGTVGLMPGHTAHARMIQTNLSLPLAILAATNPDKPMMESLFPPAAGDELELFVKIRSEVTAMYGSLTENVRSLLILILFQGTLVSSTPELTKQLFSVLVKASPADIIFSLLNDEEVDSLLDEKNTAITKGMKTGLEVLAAGLRVKAAKIDELYRILALRKKHSSMIFTERVKDYEKAYSVIPGTDERVFHDMPRASGRIYNQLRDRRIVFEIRRKAHPLNADADDPPTPADYLWERTPAASREAISAFNIQGLIDRSRDEKASNERMLLELKARYAAGKEELSRMEYERERTFKEMECVERELEECQVRREKENGELLGLVDRRKKTDTLMQASEEKMKRLKSEQEAVKKELSTRKKPQAKTTRGPQLIQSKIREVSEQIDLLERIVAKDERTGYPPIKAVRLAGANLQPALTRPVVLGGGVKRTAHPPVAAPPIAVIRRAPVFPKAKVILSPDAQQLADARKQLSALEAELSRALEEEQKIARERELVKAREEALTARLKDLEPAIRTEEENQARASEEKKELTWLIGQFDDRSREIDKVVRDIGGKREALLLRMKQLDDTINESRGILDALSAHIEKATLKKIALDSDPFSHNGL